MSRVRFNSWADLEELVRGRSKEGTHLEFKGEPYASASKPPAKRDGDKDELRRDVAAISNAGGGHLFIGVVEDAEGRAHELRPLEGVRDHENFVREVTARFIEPPFDADELEVVVASSPDRENTGVLVVGIDRARLGLPRAVVIDGKPQFFTRVGTSKREMTYAQIHSAFAAGQSGDSVVDGVGIVDGTKIESEIQEKSRSREEIPRTLQLLKALRVYAASHVFSDRVRLAVVDAVGEALDYPRRHIPPPMLYEAAAVMEEALPHAHLRVATRKLDEAEIERFRRGADCAWPLVYDGTRYLQDLVPVSVGGHLLWQILRIAQLHEIADLKSTVLEYFDEGIRYAEEKSFADGATVLRYQKADALQEQDKPPPEQLAWAVYGTPRDGNHRARRVRM
jgi:hypothetical protein